MLITRYQNTAGCDEAGRGPLVGPVVAASVILDENKPIDGLNDSKKLSPKKREAVFDHIMANAKAIGIGVATHIEIDKLNILWASMLAMKRSVDNLTIAPTKVYVDGNRTPDILYPAEAVVKGDSKIAEIAAASIVAKVTRDRMMAALDLQHPEYGFAKHAGYPTKQHIEALKVHGPIPEHRRSFRLSYD